MNIKEILQQIVLDGETGGSVGSSFLATVASVNKSNYSCSVRIVGSDGVMEDVRLKAEFGKSYGVVSIPRKGSYVVVTVMSSAVGAFVSLCSEVEKVEIEVGLLKCVIENDTISVKNNSYSLKKAFDDILDAISKLTVTTGVGPSGTPINIAEFTAVRQKLNNFLK